MGLKIKRDPIGDRLHEKSRRRNERTAETQRAEPTRPPRNDLVPNNLNTQMWPIERLRLPPCDVRKHTPAQVERIKRSIGEFGLALPLLIWTDGQIIDGGSVYLACQALGMDEVPCIVVEHLTKVQANALRLALNRLQERGEWDFDNLKVAVEELRLEDLDLAVTGFELPEIDALFLDDELNPADDELPEQDAGPPVTRLGDVWRLGKHCVACGDARNPDVYVTILKGQLVRFVFTDVPFNVKIKGHVTSGKHAEFPMASGELNRKDFGGFNTAWMDCCKAWLMPGGLLATFIDWRSVALVIACAQELGLDLINLIAWVKTNGGMGSLYRSQHELLPLFKKPGASHINNVQLGKHGRYRTNVWQYPGASSLGSDARRGLADHPTVKPVAMLEDALLDLTLLSDLVLDPFAGSGSTLIACEKTGRRCRAIELEPRYVDLIVRRWEQLTGKVAMLEATGEGFAETAARRRLDAKEPLLLEDHHVRSA